MKFNFSIVKVTANYAEIGRVGILEAGIFNKFHLSKVSEIFTILLWNINIKTKSVFLHKN